MIDQNIDEPSELDIEHQIEGNSTTPPAQAVTDAEVKSICAAGGVHYMAPDDDEIGYPGGFDMTSLDDMRKIITASRAPVAVVAEPVPKAVAVTLTWPNGAIDLLWADEEPDPDYDEGRGGAPTVVELIPRTAPPSTTPSEQQDMVITFMRAVEGPRPAALPIELQGIAEAMEEGDGFWRSCSGCHELNDGHSTGSYSSVFKCALGSGCSECGGIGAVWDDTDYDAMADQMMAGDAAQGKDAAPSGRGASGVQGAGPTDAERYQWLTRGAYVGECFTDAGLIHEIQGCDRPVPLGVGASVSEAIDAAILASAKPESEQCRTNPRYSGPANCTHGTVGCTDPDHRHIVEAAPCKTQT